MTYAQSDIFAALRVKRRRVVLTLLALAVLCIVSGTAAVVNPQETHTPPKPQYGIRTGKVTAGQQREVGWMLITFGIASLGVMALWVRSINREISVESGLIDTEPLAPIGG